MKTQNSQKNQMNPFFIEGQKSDSKFKLCKSQETKKRAMNIAFSYALDWDKLNILFELVEIEKKLSRIAIKECNEPLKPADNIIHQQLVDYSKYLVEELNAGSEIKFKLEFGEDARGLQIKLIDEENNTNILYNLYNY